MAELVDAQDSKSCGDNIMRVRPPLPAQTVKAKSGAAKSTELAEKKIS